MKRLSIYTALLGTLVVLLFFLVAGADSTNSGGEALFAKHCAMCHPDGGNIINPNKTLARKSLERNSVKSEADVVAKMRNPGPGMARFDEEALTQEQAKKIAAYVLKAFK